MADVDVGAEEARTAWVRASADAVADRVVPQLAARLPACADLPAAELRERVVGYLHQLSEAGPAAWDLLAPLVGGRDGSVDVGLGLECLHLIGNALREVARDIPGAAEAVEQWTRAAVVSVTRQAIDTAVAGYAAEVERLRVVEERLLSLQRVSAAVTSDLDLDRILTVLVEESRRLMHADTAAIRLYDERSHSLRLIASAGDGKRLLLGEVLPVEGSLSGYSFRSGQPVLSHDLPSDPRAATEIRQITAFGSALIVPLIVRDQPIGVLLVGSAARGAFTREDQTLLGLLADQAASAIENGRLYQQAQAQIAELAILHRISSVLSTSLELEEVFQAIYDEIRGVMPADAFIIGLIRDDGLMDVEFIMDGGQRFAPIYGFEFSPVFQQAIAERRPIVVGDTRDDSVPPMHTLGHPLNRVRSILAAPLIQGTQVIGLLSAQSYVPHHYRESDARLLMTIANHAVVAIANARLYRQAQSLAIAEERNRLAREIHDTLAQGLIGIILYLERLDLEIPRDDRQFRPLVERALSLARGNLEEARRSVHDLRAAPLEGRTLVDALTHLTDDLRKEAVFAVSLSVPRALPLLAARVETALFRVVQEAISNARKHAACSSLEIRLAVDDGILSLEVADDGRGFDVEQTLGESHRFGLFTMRERITQVGGQFTVESAPGRGTVVRACIPLPQATHSESPGV
ncbi:MAG: GAF domain-containing sensor histidine kinase [Sphaerobacter sp.]|nr:GAF domain-containing sensor histidine kinase [Sphaerobacter sp.]